MPRLALIAAAGLATGFALTLGIRPLDACVCTSYGEYSSLRLVEVSPTLPADKIFGGNGARRVEGDETGSITCCALREQSERYTLVYSGLRLQMVVR